MFYVRVLLTSKNEGIKLSKKTPLDNPLMPCTIEMLLAVEWIENLITWLTDMCSCRFYLGSRDHSSSSTLACGKHRDFGESPCRWSCCWGCKTHSTKCRQFPSCSCQLRCLWAVVFRVRTCCKKNVKCFIKLISCWSRTLTSAYRCHERWQICQCRQRQWRIWRREVPQLRICWQTLHQRIRCSLQVVEHTL
jgi:hypothetical protein